MAHVDARKAPSEVIRCTYHIAVVYKVQVNQIGERKRRSILLVCDGPGGEKLRSSSQLPAWGIIDCRKGHKEQATYYCCSTCV